MSKKKEKEPSKYSQENRFWLSIITFIFIIVFGICWINDFLIDDELQKIKNDNYSISKELKKLRAENKQLKERLKSPPIKPATKKVFWRRSL